ncbi:hypothetical protein [Mycobacterium sp. 852002-10029_SCH5224772]|uniref:hypothetical protein n=1 Tax=Mycobacterium sp. 852002-10029_SCH5224772 TaxID=1834083 RepID=UPI000AC84C1F|nr:hypothetical protein [Mycobacterium sp. 852002-10029_SCH5224772]
MSGQLVGEVIVASETLRARGVSERGFQALIAIAEKANTKTRQASVRWDHIRAVQYGTSLSTAKRAVKELEDAGYLRKIKRGFNNQQGRSAAPVYELCAMPVRADITRTPRDTNWSSMVTHSGIGERVTQGDPIGTATSDLLDLDSDRTGHETGPNGSNPGAERVKSETEQVTRDDLLDGLTLDGLTPDAARKPSDEKHLRFRGGGTSPGASRESAPAQFDMLAQQLYVNADMDHQCPNCRADAHEWCRRDDGSQKRIPCLARSRRPA